MTIYTSNLLLMEDSNKVVRYVAPSQEIMTKIEKIEENKIPKDIHYKTAPVIVKIENQPLMELSHVTDIDDFYNDLRKGRLKIDTTFMRIFEKKDNSLLYSIMFNVIYNYLNFSELMKHNIEVNKSIQNLIDTISDKLEKEQGIHLYSQVATIKTPADTIQHITNTYQDLHLDI